MQAQVFLLLFVATCTYAFWGGGSPERLVAATFILGLAGTALLRSPFATRFASFELGIFAADVAMLAAITGVALNAERYWPIWMSAFQTIQVFSHIPHALVPQLLPTTYLVIVGVWAYPMLLLLVLGTLRHRQRMKQYGIDASWSDFSHLPGTTNLKTSPRG